MTVGWVKLEDTFAEHPKIEYAGDQAAWLYVAGLLYAYRTNTDGFVPAAKVPKLTGLRTPLKLAERLVEANLWEPVEDGYRIHDYLEHQQSSDQRETQRLASVERLRRHREKKRGNGDATALQKRSKREGNAVGNAVRNGDETPPEGENYTGTDVSGVPHPFDSSNVVDFANVDGATGSEAA